MDKDQQVTHYLFSKLEGFNPIRINGWEIYNKEFNDKDPISFTVIQSGKTKTRVSSSAQWQQEAENEGFDPIFVDAMIRKNKHLFEIDSNTFGPNNITFKAPENKFTAKINPNITNPNKTEKPE